MTISLVNGVNPLQTTLLELGIVSGRVALLLRSAEIQPVFGRFVTEWHSPFTPTQTGGVMLPGGRRGRGETAHAPSPPYLCCRAGPTTAAQSAVGMPRCTKPVVVLHATGRPAGWRRHMLTGGPKARGRPCCNCYRAGTRSRWGTRMLPGGQCCRAGRQLQRTRTLGMARSGLAE